MDINLNDVQHEPIIVSASLIAELNRYYVNTATATYTDPTPVQGEGFIVFVRNGTATVGATAYATAGTIVYRYYHSGAWASYVYNVSGTFQPLDSDLTSIAGLSSTSAYLRRSAANTYVLDSYATTAGNMPSTSITAKVLTGGSFPNGTFATTDTILQALEAIDDAEIRLALIVGDFNGTGGTAFPAGIGSIIVSGGVGTANNVLLSLNATGGTFGLDGNGALTFPNASASHRGLLLAADFAKFQKKEIQLACSDETTALTTGTAKVTFRMPHAATITGVRGSLSTSQGSGSIFTVDINENGTSILSTKLTINNTEKTSTTAATAAVISDASIADDAEITIDIDQIGNGTAKGLKVTILYTIA